jgi:prepilin-type N-terminal cleavage/methylation domain-containing protein
MKRDRGFTLVELIIVVSITTLLGLIMTDVLIQTLRGETKAKLVSTVKQNGQVILENLVNQIRQSEKVICVGDNISSPVTDTIVIFKQGSYIRYRMVAPSPLADPTANGYIAFDTFTADDYPLISEDRCNDVTLIASRTSYLTDTDPTKGISIFPSGEVGYTDNIFKRVVIPGFNDAVDIKFRASAGVTAGSAYEVTVKEGGILFNTTVGVRTKK